MSACSCCLGLLRVVCSHELGEQGWDRGWGHVALQGSPSARDAGDRESCDRRDEKGNVDTMITLNERTEATNDASRYPGLERQPDQSGTRGLLFRAVRRFLRAQFGRPTGVWGSIAGRIMARRPSNHLRIRWTLGLLDIRPSDRILEIGFGPGIAIALASELASKGFVTGVDHSEVMVRQASKRNVEAIREGRVTLLLGSAASLPDFERPFDKIFTINSIHFWNEPRDCLRRLRRLLKPDGLLAVTVQPRSRGATHETARMIGEDLMRSLEGAGFSDCRLEVRPAKPISVACVLGTRRGEE
jgi:SAM-dependent methyltransferase